MIVKIVKNKIKDWIQAASPITITRYSVESLAKIQPVYSIVNYF